MKSMDKWNKIVEHFSKHKKSKEAEIQSLWEEIFSSVFGFSRALEYLDAQKSYDIGSSGKLRPDIILKKEGKAVCAIELKQESITLDKKIENQLFSYLKQTKINIGLVIADKIYLYAYEYQKDDSEQTMIEIPFDKNNPDGELFIDLLSYDAFADGAISKFVNEKLDHLNNVKNIRESISKNFVIDALKNYLGGKYTSDEVEEALDSIEIIIEKKKEGKEKKNDNIKNVIQPLEDDICNGIDSNVLIEGGKKASIYIREFLLNKKYITDDVKTTLAKINKDSKKENKRYWANPSIEFLKYDWLLILNDNINRELHIFRIPANNISLKEVKTREHQGKKLLDLEIVNVKGEFVCMASKIQFNKWLVETKKY